MAMGGLLISGFGVRVPDGVPTVNARPTLRDLFLVRVSPGSEGCHDRVVSIGGVFVNARERREVAAGETIFAEGDTGREMFGLISGAVALRRDDDTVKVLEPGETFGEMSIVSDAPRSLT